MQELHPRGVQNLCIQVVLHTLRDFGSHQPKYRGHARKRLQELHCDYMQRIMFLCNSGLFVHTIDVMGYDVDKMRDNMIKIVDKKYEIACRYYENLLVDKPYL